MISTGFALIRQNTVLNKLKLSTTIPKRGLMDTYIETPKMSEILSEEFMEPMGISAYKLANDIHVPVSRIQDILHNRRKVSADTSIRLGKYFGVSEKYFLNIQNDIDIRNTLHDKADEFSQIKAIQYS